MPSLKKIPTGAVAALAALAVGVPAASADTILSGAEPGPTVVAAYAGTVMWSSKDAVTGQYKLMKSVDGGAPVAVGVPERDGPFDIDLGTNRSGSLYAVYTREGFIYRLRVATGTETKLTSLSIGGQNQRPTIQRGRIAFIHSGRGHDELRIGDTTSGAGKPKVLVRGVIDDVELGIKQVAYVSQSKGNYGFGAKTVHIRNIRTGHDLAVYKSQSGGANAAGVTKPSFTDDLKAFVWARTNNGSGTGNRIIKYTLRTGKLSYAQGSWRYATTAWAGDELGAAYSTALESFANDGCDDAGKHYCTVGITGPLTFNRKP